MTFTHRAYKDEKDYRQMVHLLSDAFTINGAPVYVTAGELDWWRCLSQGRNPIRTAQLWLDDKNRLVGFAWLNGNSLDMLALPTRHAAEKEMLAWAEEKLRAQTPITAESRPSNQLRAWSLTSDTARHTLFSRVGFQKTHEYFAFNFRTLEEPLPEPHLPDGYSLRGVSGPAELPARVSVHCAAFENDSRPEDEQGSPPCALTLSKYRAMARYPSYRYDLDRVAVASGGELAAFCIAWLDEPNHHGALEPAGCAPAHRNKALTNAVVADALRCLKNKGAKTASAFTWCEDEIPARLYHSMGFHELDRVEAWEKPL